MEVDNVPPNGPAGNRDLSPNGMERALSNEETEMLERLSKVPELRVKSQQRTETDLSNEQKLDVLKGVYVQSPLQFLTRFGNHLKDLKDLECFEDVTDQNVQVCLKDVKRKVMKAKTVSKNRRYAALQKMVETSNYFTEEEMQRRNPILYDQLIGKFQTKEEKEAFLQRSYEAAGSSSTTPLTDLLMAHMNRNEQNESIRRLDQEHQKEAEDEADAEYCDEEDEEMDEGEKTKRPSASEEAYEEIDDDEKELFKEEFFTTMYQNFLDGKDEDFDYSTVDNNEEYDVGENVDQDEEDKYFDDEDPCEIHSESGSDIETMFRPPVRCSEIEGRIQELKVNGDNNKGQTNSADFSDEDALDAYMRSIETELKR